jgi:hypothetical protein
VSSLQEVHRRRMVNLPGYKKDAFRLQDNHNFVPVDLTAN